MLKPKIQLDALLVYVAGAAFTWNFYRRSPLGLFYVAQHAVDSGYHVRIDNLSANDHLVSRLSRILSEHSCDLIGFYVDHENIWDLRRILPALKHQRHQLTIILGGPQVTVAPISTLERLPQALCGVIGEGEETFVDILSINSKLTPETLKTCAGLAIRLDEGCVLTSPRIPIKVLDSYSIPQRRKLVLDIDNHQSIEPTMITGRGCHGRCAFCFEGRDIKIGKRLRFHSAQRCLEEFDYLTKEFDNQYISILDDSFVAHPRRLREICKGLIKRYNGQIKWFCEARVDTLTRHPDLLPLMIEAGLLRLQVGGESGNQHILDKYKKDTTLEQMYNVVDSAKKNGLFSLFANFIIGGCSETRDTYQQTLDFALELIQHAPGCMTVGHSFLTPYPGTPIFENPELFGIEIIDGDVVTGSNDAHVYCRTEQLSKYEILELGYDFEQNVRKKMKTLIKDLPYETINEHFRVNHIWGLSTKWYELLSAEIPIYSYFSSINKSTAVKFSDAIEKDFVDIYPIRNIELVSSKQNKYVIRSPIDGVLELDELSSVILELSAGKLSFDDMITIICEHIPNVKSTDLRKSVIERYKDFDRQYLISFKTNFYNKVCSTEEMSNSPKI